MQANPLLPLRASLLEMGTLLYEYSLTGRKRTCASIEEDGSEDDRLRNEGNSDEELRRGTDNIGDSKRLALLLPLDRLDASTITRIAEV